MILKPQYYGNQIKKNPDQPSINPDMDLRTGLGMPEIQEKVGPQPAWGEVGEGLLALKRVHVRID